jgi:hypothetical protein
MDPKVSLSAHGFDTLTRFSFDQPRRRTTTTFTSPVFRDVLGPLKGTQSEWSPDLNHPSHQLSSVSKPQQYGVVEKKEDAFDEATLRFLTYLKSKTSFSQPHNDSPVLFTQLVNQVIYLYNFPFIFSLSFSLFHFLSFIFSLSFFLLNFFSTDINKSI